MVREGLRAMLTSARNQVVGESSDPARAIADLLLLQPDVVLLILRSAVVREWRYSLR